MSIPGGSVSGIGWLVGASGAVLLLTQHREQHRGKGLAIGSEDLGDAAPTASLRARVEPSHGAVRQHLLGG